MGYGKVPALAAAWAKALGDTPRGLPPLPFIRTDCEVSVGRQGCVVWCCGEGPGHGFCNMQPASGVPHTLGDLFPSQASRCVTAAGDGVTAVTG
jgi:hypothetical protein